jgi:signal transduction histidine kinase
MHPVIRFSSILAPLLIAVATILYSAGINPHSATWLAGFYVTLTLLIHSLLRTTRSPLYRSYSLYLAMLSLYLVAVWLLHAMVPGADVDATKQRVAFWTRILCVGSVFMPVTLYHLTLRFSEVKWRPWFAIEVIGWILAAFFYMTNITGHFLKDFVWSGVTWVPTMDGTYRHFFFVTSFYVTLGVLVPLLSIFKTHERQKRLQLSYYLLGAIPLWVSCWGHFLISLGINIYPAGGTIFLLHAAIMAYAVIQRRLFDFSFVLRRALVYAALSSSLGMLYAAILGAFLLFQNFGILLGERMHTILFIIFAGFIIAPLHSYCQHFIDQIFYREERNQQRILQSFAQQTAMTVDMKCIADSLCRSIDRGLELKSVRLFLKDDKDRNVLFAHLENGTLQFSDWPNADCLAGDLASMPSTPTLVSSTVNGPTATSRQPILITERDENLCVPLKQGERAIGCLLLGAKRADEPFSEDDFRFVEIVASYSAVALVNGHSYLQLQHLQELTTETLDGLATGIVLLDRSGVILRANNAAKSYFPDAVLFPRSAQELWSMQPILGSIIKRALKECCAITNMEVRLEAKGPLSILLSIRPLSHKGNTLFLLILHDISEYKAMEEHSRHREHLARLGETISGINHEIKNVVQPIRFQVETLSELKIENADFKRCMSILPNRLGALDRLLTDLRDLARPLELRKMLLDLCEVCDSVLRDIRRLDLARGVEIVNQIDQAGKSCYADGHWLKLVLFNLLRNAVEATSGRLNAEIRISAETKESQILIHIVDNGCGISAKSMQQMFKPFFSTKGEAGTGLGMAISQKVIELHGGKITVQSELNAGTQVTVSIPHTQASAELAAESVALKDE